MTIRVNKLPYTDQLKFNKLSKADKEEILKCKNIAMASEMLKNKNEEVVLHNEIYNPKLQVSGSTVKYETKNLFTDIFDEKDVKDFMMLVQMSESMDNEVITGELKRKIADMSKVGKQPLQCLVYSTKNREKEFYKNKAKVRVWAQVIAETVNVNQEYIFSLSHMLVNWKMWKYQIDLLITACGHIIQNETIDEVLRDLYIDYSDDAVRLKVLKRLLCGSNLDNYKSAFKIVKKYAFTGFYKDMILFHEIKKKVDYASEEEHRKLYEAYIQIQSVQTVKSKRLDSLFIEKTSSNIAERINQSTPVQKDTVLKEVYHMIYGSPKEYHEISRQSAKIKLYKGEIQDMFMSKMKNNSLSLEEIRACGLAIGKLDTNGEAVSFLEEQMFMGPYESEKLMYASVLASISDDHVSMFIDKILKCDVGNDRVKLQLFRQLNHIGKTKIAKQSLYENSMKIKDQYGIESKEFEICLRNIELFVQKRSMGLLFDDRFDQLLFDFLGYDKTTGAFDKIKCSDKAASLVLQILESIMTKRNYEGRYMEFMWHLFVKFKNENIDFANKIDGIVKHLTGQGSPSI